MIYHITSAREWQLQINASEFIPSDYQKEGFVHCCTSEQLAGVIERYFKGMSGLVLLQLDEIKFTAELKFEPSTNDEKFPHLYGYINREAIVEITYL